MSDRFVVWRGIEGLPLEAARIALSGDGVRATGTQIGAEPLPYRLDYELVVEGGWLGTRFGLSAAGEGWTRGLELRGDRDGRWSASFETSGDPELADPGGDTARSRARSTSTSRSRH